MQVDRRSVVIAALGILAIGAVSVTPSSDQVAVELLRVMRIDKTTANSGEAIADVMIKANPVLLPYRPVIIEWVHKTMSWDALEPKVAAVYSQAFTDDEMRQAMDFYRSPTGQKFLDKLPELMQKTGAISSELGKAHEAELRAMIAQRAKELSEKTPNQ